MKADILAAAGLLAGALQTTGLLLAAARDGFSGGLFIAFMGSAVMFVGNVTVLVVRG